MSRFGYLAAEKYGFITRHQLNVAFQEQWRQDCNEPDKPSDPLGSILVDREFMSAKERDAILEDMLMEPGIDWGHKTNFAKMLNVEKPAKQAIGEYVGRRIAKRPKGETIFLSNSSTIYYAFRGMVKHGASVNVLTIHAAILAVYPSLESKIKSVGTIWKGHVDLDNALIEPPDLNDFRTKKELDVLNANITHILISATGFDSACGPMADNSAAREVARRALQSETHTCILIDHTKVRCAADKHEPSLLFREKEWSQIRGRGDVEVVTNCHPQMPQEQAVSDIGIRDTHAIRDILSQRNAPKRTIDKVLAYQQGVMQIRDIVTEVRCPEVGFK